MLQHRGAYLQAPEVWQPAISVVICGGQSAVPQLIMAQLIILYRKCLFPSWETNTLKLDGGKQAVWIVSGAIYLVLLFLKEE